MVWAKRSKEVFRAQESNCSYKRERNTIFLKKKDEEMGKRVERAGESSIGNRVSEKDGKKN